MSKIVVLMSGGIDSTTLCHLAMGLDRLHSAICFDYRQPAARQERWAVSSWAALHYVDVHYINVTIPGTRDHMALGPGEDGLRVLPGRNMILLAHACNYAVVSGADTVWYGATKDDRAYPDCRPEWLRAFNAMATAGSGVAVEAPYIDKTKADVVRAARALDVDLGATWSCYDPLEGMPCGGCHSCKERAAARVAE